MARAGPPTGGEDIKIAHLQKEIRAEVAAIVGRLNELIIHPPTADVARLPDIIVVQEDLDRTSHNINLCTRQGFVWGADEYGCTEKEMTGWRSLVSATLADLKTRDFARREASTSRKYLNSRHCEAGWPKQINDETWQSYFMTWMQERDNFPSDWHRCQHLKAALSPEDKESFASATNPDVILYGLMRRYGSETDFVLTKLRELNKLRKPSTVDLVHITHNMNVLRKNIMFIRDLNQTRRLEAGVVRDIVNTALDRDTLKKHNIEFMQFRAKHLAEASKVCPGITADNFSKYFNSGDLLDDRLDFLTGFLDQALEYNRLLHHGRTKPPETGRLAQPPSLPLAHKWVCRICGTSHSDLKTNKDRKWYLGICSAFYGTYPRR